MAQETVSRGAFHYRKVHIFKAQPLGIGSYGAVYRAQCDELPSAAKVLHPILCQSRAPGERKAQERFEQECLVLKEIHHPRIVQYLGTSVDPDTRLLVLLMELMEESLTSFLERSPLRLPYHVQVVLSHDIAVAVAYLHTSGVIHRDLSANNILLCGGRAKVTDFGMAKLVDEHMAAGVTPTNCPGTQSYMPPEALQDSPSYTEKIDCFSMGVLFIQVLTRRYPEPGPRWVNLEDARSPTGMVHLPIPEVKRRDNHISLVETTHPLLPIALDCMKDKSRARPSAGDVCVRLATLEAATAFRDSLEESRTKLGHQTDTTGDAELEGEEEGEGEREGEEDGEGEWEGGRKGGGGGKGGGDVVGVGGGGEAKEEKGKCMLVLENELCQLREKVKRQEAKMKALLAVIEERDAMILSACQESEGLRRQLHTPANPPSAADEEEEEATKLSSNHKNLLKLLHLKGEAIRESVAQEKKSQDIVERLQNELSSLTKRLEYTQQELKKRNTSFCLLQNEATELQQQVEELQSRKIIEQTAAGTRERELQWKLSEAKKRAEEAGRQVGDLQTKVQQLKVKAVEEQTSSKQQTSLLSLKQMELQQTKQELYCRRQIREKVVHIQTLTDNLGVGDEDTDPRREEEKRTENGGEGGAGWGEEEGWRKGGEGKKNGDVVPQMLTDAASAESADREDSDSYGSPLGSGGFKSSEDEAGKKGSETENQASWTVLLPPREAAPSFSVDCSSRDFSAPCEMSRGTSVVSGSVVYFRAESWRSKYKCFNMLRNTWLPSLWPNLPLSGCSLGLVGGRLTMVGGYDQWHLDAPTNTLLTQSEDGEEGSFKWSEVFPPMLTHRYWATVVPWENYLIVAGGHDGKQELSSVEVLDTENFRWHTARSLPVPLTNATGVVCRHQLHIAGGLSNDRMTNTVLTCSLSDLLNFSLRVRIKKAFSPSVARRNIWKKCCLPDLPVYQTTLVSSRDHLLAVGGCNDLFVPTDAIFLFHAATLSWEVCGRMKCPRRLCFAVSWPQDGSLMVVGGYTSRAQESDLVEVIQTAQERDRLTI